MHINYALAGKALVVWLVVSAIASPLLGRMLARRRAHNEMVALYEREVVRQRHLLEVADRVLAERNRLARDAARPISDREWSDARAWLCDDDNQPKRAS